MGLEIEISETILDEIERRGGDRALILRARDLVVELGSDSNYGEFYLDIMIGLMFSYYRMTYGDRKTEDVIQALIEMIIEEDNHNLVSGQSIN